MVLKKCRFLPKVSAVSQNLRVLVNYARLRLRAARVRYDPFRDPDDFCGAHSGRLDQQGQSKSNSETRNQLIDIAFGDLRLLIKTSHQAVTMFALII